MRKVKTDNMNKDDVEAPKEEENVQTGITEQGRGSSIRLYVLSVTSIASTLFITFMNQKLFTVHAMNPLQLLFFHSVCGAATSALLMRRNPSTATYNLVAPWYTVVFSGVLSMLTIGCQNWSLQLNDVGSFQMIKLLGTPLSALIEYFQGATLQQRAWMGLFALPFGVGLLTLEGVRFQMFGWLVGFAAVLLSIGSLLSTKAILKIYSQPTLAYQWRLVAIMALCCMPTLVMFDLPELTPMCLFYLCCSSALGASIQLLSIYITIEFTATTYLVVGLMKTLVIVASGILLNDDPLTFRTLLGCAFSVWGLATYEKSRAHMSELRKAQQADPSVMLMPKTNIILDQIFPIVLLLATASYALNLHEMASGIH